MILHDHELSTECYAVRLLASLLGLEYDRRLVDLHPGAETAGEVFLALNPLGEIPVVEVADERLCDWIAILVYLARAAGGVWLPSEPPLQLAAVCEVLGLARRLSETLGAVRRNDLFGVVTDAEPRRREAHRLLRALDARLWFLEQDGHAWVVAGPCPSIADVAVFVQVAFSEDAGVSRQDYPAVRRWLDRCRRLDGFVAMGGVAAAPPVTRSGQLAR